MLQSLINQVKYVFKTKLCWDDFPDSPVVNTLPFNGNAGLIPDPGAGPHMPQDPQKKYSKHKTEAIL